MSRGRKALNIPVILAVEDWINRMLRMFGLGLGSSEGADGRRVIGWGKASDGVSKGAVNVSRCFPRRQTSSLTIRVGERAAHAVLACLVNIPR